MNTILYAGDQILTLNLLMTTIVAPPSNASKWQMGFNSAFKGLMATSEDELQTMANHLNLIARKYKMTISSTKTKSMAVCGNHIQRVKMLTNDNIIEHVTDSKYLGYRISEYKSYLEDKLQTYNKINGAIRRHFGKQMNKETKLRIHNITAKAALKFGSEAWVLKKREEQHLETAQMKF